MDLLGEPLPAHVNGVEQIPLSVPDQYAPKEPTEKSPLRIAGAPRSAFDIPRTTRSIVIVNLREIVMIHHLNRQGLGIAAIARRTGLDRKTVRKYLERGMETARYGPRLIDPYEDYLRGRIAAYPGLSGRRLWRAVRELGYAAVTDFLREARPPSRAGFELRFETLPSRQAQADFAQFKVA